jgi:DNA-binding CsgD family transcriptional regulator
MTFPASASMSAKCVGVHGGTLGAEYKDGSRWKGSLNGFDSDRAVALQGNADRLGVVTNACGVSAEPPGAANNGMQAIRRLWPEQIVDMYYAMGGEQADPTIAYSLRRTDSFVVDAECLLLSCWNSARPFSILIFGSSCTSRDVTVSHERPFLTTFNIPMHAIGEFRRDAARIRETLRLMASAFWDLVQSRHLASSITRLSRRQAEVLKFAARGFTVAETAEHMGISLRSAEKTLAAARKQLGARTTAAAVYRALVFRALT